MPDRSTSDPIVVLGIIAGTHGTLSPAVKTLFQGVDRIIHAGVIDTLEVLNALQRMAPVTAVRGNMDAAGGLRDLPETEAVAVGGTLIYVIHQLQRLDIAPAEAGFDAVISGHLHRPEVIERQGVLFLNPGSPSLPRHRTPPSVALLYIRGKTINARIVSLAHHCPEPAAP